MCWKKLFNKVTDSMLDHVGIYSIFLGTLTTVGGFLLPIGRMRVIPHIITYASCNLALIGFIFSIILGLRGGEIYDKLRSKYPGKVKQIYKCIFKITMASSACALLSMVIYAIDVWILALKWCLAFLLCVIFIYMVTGTLLIFNVLIDLLIKDDKIVQRTR